MLTSAAPRARATMPTPAGHVPTLVAEAFERGLFALPPAPTARAATQRREWRIPIIRVQYPDSALGFSAQALESQLFDTLGTVPTGSFTEYWTSVSRGQLRVTGEVVATVTLPRERNFYANDAWGLNTISTPGNIAGLLKDAVFLSDPQVDWRRFDLDGDTFVDMVWIVHPTRGGELSGSRRDLWSVTSAMSGGWGNAAAIETQDLIPGSTTQHIRIDRFSTLPERSGFVPGGMSEIGVYCHEFGHALGLPDLYDTSTLGGAANVGPGNWSLMSTGTYGGDNASPQSPTHIGGWPMRYLAFADWLHPEADTTLTLAPLAAGGAIVNQSFEGGDISEHLVLECRHPSGIDRSLPGSGLLITLVDEALIGQRIASNRINNGPTPALRIIEGDADADLIRGFNRGDAADPLPGSRAITHVDDDTSPSLRSISGAATDLVLDGVTRVGDGVRVRVGVQPRGWLASQATLAQQPIAAFGPARRFRVRADGTQLLVQSQQGPSGSQVVLHERRRGQAWSEPFVVRTNPSGAFEPTLALLPGDDVAVAWTDVSGSASQIRTRMRVRGVWQDERVISQSAEGAVSPALAADERGRVALAWLDLEAGDPRVRLLTFVYTSPFGTPHKLTGAGALPSAPAIAMARDGQTTVAWADRASGRDIVWFSRLHPDSGLSAPLRLTPNTAASQPAVSIEYDSSGTLHAVWQSIGDGPAQLHYQRRSRFAAPSPRDTVIEAAGDALQNPDLTVDLRHGVHVAYERSSLLGVEVRYLRWRPGEGWDRFPTRVTEPGDERTARPGIGAITHGSIDVVYTSFDGAEITLRTRSRRTDGEEALDAPPHPAVPPSTALAVRPLPVRTGRMLEARGPELTLGSRVDLIDASGRRVAETVCEQTGVARFGPSATQRLTPGIYFVRRAGTDRAARVVVLR